MKMEILRVVSAALIFFLLPFAGKSQAAVEDGDRQSEGRVYAMANEAGGNNILVFRRASDGTLTLLDRVPTGGLGSGPGPLPGSSSPGPIPLNSQDSLISTEDGHFLIAVNAGSNDISVFEIRENGLRLTDREPSGGIFPVSLACHQGLLYALNVGGPKSFVPNPSRPAPLVAGFRLDEDGKLHAIPNSVQVVGTSVSVPADLVFNSNGKLLVVTEVQSSSISVFSVDDDGYLHSLVNTPSVGRNPFGAALGPHHTLAVAEGHEIGTNGLGIPSATAVTTYRISSDGNLEPLSQEVGSNQTAGLWIRFSPDGRYAFTSNIGSATISSFLYSSNGQLSLLAGVAAATGQPGRSLPIDLGITPNGRFLYVDAINFFQGAVEGFRIEEDGSLTPVASVGGLPISIEGIVAQ